MRQSKQLSKQAYAYAWNRCWWLSSIQIPQSSVVVISTSSYLQLISSVVGWKRSRRQVAWYTSHCHGINQKFSVVDNTLLPSQWRFRVQARTVRCNSISTFNVPRSLSVGLRPSSWFSESQYKFSCKNHSKYNVYEPVNGPSHLFTSNQLATAIGDSDAQILGSVNI